MASVSYERKLGQSASAAAARHNIESVLIRGGAKVLVSRGLRTSDAYARFLAETERHKLLNGATRQN